MILTWSVRGLNKRARHQEISSHHCHAAHIYLHSSSFIVSRIDMYVALLDTRVKNINARNIQKKKEVKEAEIVKITMSNMTVVGFGPSRIEF